MNVSSVLGSIYKDARHGSRALVRNPGFTIVAVMTLALGIGACTAIFSFVDAVLLKPLPYGSPDRIVRVLETRPDGVATWVSTPDYLDWETDNTVFEYLAARQTGLVTLSGIEEPVPLRVERVTAKFFDIFGVETFLGRTFLESEDVQGNDRVVVLSYALWQSQFGGDEQIIGRAILLDGEPYTVIGVMPADSAFNRSAAQIWHPLALETYDSSRSYRWLSATFGLLKPGVSVGEARAQMRAIAARIAEDYPDTNRGWNVSVELYADTIVGAQLKTSVLALMAAVGGLLLICCSNVASIVLARAISRDTEAAVRSVLGATRLRLAQQYFCENAVLAIIGGLLGIGVAWACVRLFIGLIPPGTFPSETNVQLDLRTLTFALVALATTSILFGLLPALSSRKALLAHTIRAGKRTTDKLRRLLMDGLVVGEVATSFLLLCCAVLLIRSFVGLVSIEPGFTVGNALTMRLPVSGFPPGSDYESPEEFKVYLRELETSVRAIPGVRHVAATSALPLTDCCLYGASPRVEGRPAEDPANRGGAVFKVVTPSYFSTLGLELLRGRALTDRDTADSRRVIVINERLARLYFADENPVGQRILNPEILPGRTQRGPEAVWEVVGVVRDERLTALDEETRPAIYASYEQSPVYFVSLVVESDLPADSLERSVRSVIADIDSTQSVLDVRTLAEIKQASVGNERFQAALLNAFSLTALVLTAIGIFGMLARLVGERSREIGIRAALGATRSDLLRMVLGRGMTVTTVGLAIGLVAAYVLSPLLEGLLYGVDARDPLFMSAAFLGIAVAAFLACLIPAQRAAAADPSGVLRSE
jgi:putative ABC transport system permease protein